MAGSRTGATTAGTGATTGKTTAGTGATTAGQVCLAEAVIAGMTGATTAGTGATTGKTAAGPGCSGERNWERAAVSGFPAVGSPSYRELAFWIGGIW